MNDMFNLLNSVLGMGIITIVFTGLCFLQVFLSKRTKFLGLVLPAVSLVLSIAFSIPNIRNTFYISFSEGAFFASLLAFAVMNIPTMVFLSIYLYSLKKAKQQKELEKMTIQDLK